MNIEVYQKAISEFVWSEQTESQNAMSDISDKDLASVVQETATKIVSISQIRELISNKVGQPVSLLEASCLVMQDKDKQLNPSTLQSIQRATTDEKIVLARTFKELSKLFTQVNEPDLKGLTLLFAIHRVKALVAAKIAPAQTHIEQMEKTLAELIVLRGQYHGKQLQADQQQLMDQVDAKIAEMTKKIEELKLTQDLAVLKV